MAHSHEDTPRDGAEPVSTEPRLEALKATTVLHTDAVTAEARRTGRLKSAPSQDDAPLPGPCMPQAQRGGPMPLFDREMLADWHVRLVLVLLAVLLFFPGIGAFGLWDPWEVHYGEVGRQMVERHDWISPWWGSHWVAPGKTAEGEYFFSKPVLLLWMMGIGLDVFGFSEIGIRFGTALIALLGVVMTYVMGSRVFTRRAGVLMAVALMTSPFYAMLGRQAQTDMPFVGTMTVAMCFFMMGVFGRDRDRRVDKVTFGLFSAAILAIVIPQLHTITVGQWNLPTTAGLSPLERYICWGPVQLGIYVVLIAVFFASAILSPQRTRGQIYLYGFYAFVGLATMGKGLLGFGLPGAMILAYLVVTREWGLLKRVELFRGVLVALFVGMPWYGAVLARHGGINGPFWQRFIIHDHFKRLASGVHQIDTGSFEHFVKWLGYGLFPWGGLVPGVFVRAFSGAQTGSRSDADRARTLLFLWFAIAFSLFTLSSTKFHHYIFPAVPPMAMLAALFLDELIDGKVPRTTWFAVWVGGMALTVLVGFDIVSDPQHLKNLFTYRYDRLWGTDAWDPGFKSALRIFFVAALTGFAMLAASRRRRVVVAGVVVLALQALVMAVWTLNVYMPTISPTWSQKQLWDRYYELCTHVEPHRDVADIKHDRYCLESVISYKLNWRGETYYTQNEVIPVRDDEEWNYFIEQNGDRCFYAIMEYSRVAAFRSALPAAQRSSVTTEHEQNMKFTLVSANCHPEPAAPAEPESGDSTE